MFCVITGYPPIAAAFLLIPIAFESMLFLLGMAKFYRAVKEGWGKTTVMRRFLEDGVWAFVFPFGEPRLRPKLDLSLIDHWYQHFG